MRALNGSCRTPIGAYAILENQQMTLNIAALRQDGGKIWKEKKTTLICTDQEADQLGFSLGLTLKKKIDPNILD